MKKCALALLAVTALAGCSSHYSGQSFALSENDAVVLMPLVNHSTTPLAGEKAEDILRSLWIQQGNTALTVYPRGTAANDGLPDLDDQKRYERVRGWLAQQSASYYLSGSVSEWRYKSGLSGEPTVGLTVNLHCTSDDQVVWSATGARSGWDRESLSGTAQKVMAKILSDIEMETE